MNGIERIAAERKRQIEKEGWTETRDDQHKKNEMAIAAACYALPENKRASSESGKGYFEKRLPNLWPWHRGYWKPTPENRIRELEKAGALIAAEIDRLLRLEAANAGT